MEPDFFAELDTALSNVGSDTVWKRTIGGIELWISPLQLTGQEKVAETITKLELGSSIISESKRMTLSYAIVGIGEHDLRQYRGGSAVFPITGRDGKPAKTTLDRYLHHKLGTWGAQFIDDAFAVYADLMETLQKDHLKDIKFDNAKDPREELADLQVRVFELRQQLGMSELVEKGTVVDPADLDERTPEQAQAQADVPDEAAFDPFSMPPPQASAPTPTPTPASTVRQSIPNQPIVPDSAAAARARENAEIETLPFPPPATPTAPLIAAPQGPANPNLVEKPASRAPVAPPVIDRIPVSKNPRFSRPQR